jgi:hypothetical protein
MSFLGKLFGTDKTNTKSAVCDFCGRRVSEPGAKTALIKGADGLADFEQKSKRKHQRPASKTDPKDGEEVFFACSMCLLRYLGRCTKCGSVAEELIPSVLRDPTGKEVEALLCTKCMGGLFDSGSTLGGVRR